MTIGDIKRLYLLRLLPIYGEQEAGAIFYLVAEQRLGLSRSDVILYPEREAGDVAAQRTMEAMLEELAAHRPVQYVLGRVRFCGMDFEVGEGVLVPRPETEEMVGLIAAGWQGRRREQDRAPRILDIGTGSAAIAVSLAAMLPEAEVTAMDISDAALEIARRNGAAARVEVEFVKADILSAPLPAGLFDIIVSNPPYVPRSDMGSMARNVLNYEPHAALFVEDGDPLLFYRAISHYAAEGALRKGGEIWLEIYEKFAEGVAKLLEADGFTDIEVIKDINSKDRIVRCRKS